MDITPDEVLALKVAGDMIDAGIPVFAAAPNPDRPGHYYLPKEWEKTMPARSWLEKWRPGWALGAVGGHVADFLDFDPRNGGDQSMRELEIQRQMPRAFGIQATPSGGTHLVISPTGERKSTGFMPGVDLQSGNDQGVGRGFVYIAPTVRPSKAPETLGQLRAYRWEQEPDLEYLKEFGRGADDTLDGILARVHAVRNASSAVVQSSAQPDQHGSQLFMQGGSGHRQFTRAEAEAFCTPHLDALQRAEIGEIEEHANRAAAALSHFVPDIWSAQEAFTVLTVALGETAYDPDHPASGWTADKFLPVLDGRRPPLDAWKATKRVESVTEVTPASDAVDALIGEMRKPSEVIAQTPPRPLVRGLLNLDSESWIIGAPGSKKSFVATDIAGHVAHGMVWQGRRVHQGRVVMIVAEGAGGLGPRLRAWELEHGKAMSEDILILPRPVQAADLQAWAVLIEACRRLQPVLVVLDTQARVTVGLEENSAKEMGTFIEAVRAVREATGACVLTVHHTGRQGGDARGSSAIDGAQHTELKVVAERGSLRGKLVSEKQKDMALADDVELVFAVHTVGVDEDGEDVTSLALVSDAFRKLAGTGEGRPEDPAGSVLVSEPQDWTAHFVPGVTGADVIKRQLLQTLAELAGQGDGRTESDLRAAVTERWYAERSASGRTRRGVDKQTWDRTWTAVEALEIQGDFEPEPLMIKTGRRFKINPLFLVTGQ